MKGLILGAMALVSVNVATAQEISKCGEEQILDIIERDVGDYLGTSIVPSALGIDPNVNLPADNPFLPDFSKIKVNINVDLSHARQTHYSSENDIRYCAVDVSPSVSDEQDEVVSKMVMVLTTAKMILREEFTLYYKLSYDDEGTVIVEAIEEEVTE